MKSDLKLAILFHTLYSDRINQITAGPLHVLEMLTSDCELAQVGREGWRWRTKYKNPPKENQPEMS